MVKVGVKSLCVANLSLSANNDGIYPCKDPKFVTANDFFFSHLQLPPATTNERETIVSEAFDFHLPGLNTLGMSMALTDIGPGSRIPPHFHPDTSKLVTVYRGAILIQFNTSSPENRSFTRVVRESEVFVVPKGLHLTYRNYGETDAAVLEVYSSQRPKFVYVG
ncbi:germin-like protein [Tanacetum coccineum]|uniref:Germin-like protein n=1 Tax=Tanacetum coccineum TaxID=301880 RepID=A0ABQ5AMM3_9ASTR